MGDIRRSEARIVSVTNSSEGEIVKVTGHRYCNNQPVIEVVSSFLYRASGSLVDYENTFDTTEEPDYPDRFPVHWHDTLFVIRVKVRLNSCCPS